MQSHLTREVLAHSVIAVPPLARTHDFTIDALANRKIVNHLEAGGIRTLLYGGNANLYHIRLKEYGMLLNLLSDAAGEDTAVIPSVGPAYGTMMAQIEMLKSYDFASAMVLPTQEIVTSAGIATGIRHAAEAYGKPLVLYIKHEKGLSPADCTRLVNDGVVAAIKYAIVLDEPARDPYLTALLNGVSPDMVVSGMGEQPAIVHMREFGLVSFTSGCVCIAPALSQQMLIALRAKMYAQAEEIRAIFEPLENLRNDLSPIRVLHEAVRLAGIADTGPLLPMLSNLDKQHYPAVEEAVRRLKALGVTNAE